MTNIDLTLSSLAYSNPMYGGEATTFTLTALDEDSDSATGNLVYLYAGQACEWDSDDECNVDAAQNYNVNGIPQEIKMTDEDGDGTYTADLTVSDVGTISVYAKVYYQGLIGTYTDEISAIREEVFGEGLTHDWGSGPIPNIGVSADANVEWSGFILPPQEDAYEIYLKSDNTGEFQIFPNAITGNRFCDYNPTAGPWSLENELTSISGTFRATTEDLIYTAQWVYVTSHLNLEELN